jgi:oxygen-independent coproporphyrinogen-3 oxidase
MEADKKALSFVPHLELCFDGRAQTAMMIQTGKMEAPKDDVAQEHFMILLER